MLACVHALVQTHTHLDCNKHIFFLTKIKKPKNQKEKHESSTKDFENR